MVVFTENVLFIIGEINHQKIEPTNFLTSVCVYVDKSVK